MKKIIGKLAGIILTAATLFSVASCKDQLDYVNDTTALNKFNVLGLSVTGLDAAYNHADVALMVREKDNEKGEAVFESYVSGKVSDSYTNANGETIGYKEGTAYIKLDAAKLFDGDSLHTSTFECYLKVGDNTIKLLDGENAKLAVPTSPANTDDKDLKNKWVDVVVNGDYGTFSLKNDAKEADFVNVTLYNIKLDLMNATKDNLPAGVTVTLEDKAASQTFQKYTVKMTGLKENSGMKVILGGSTVTDEDGKKQDLWYNADKFGKTISDKGEVEWSFYGTDVSYLAYRSYGEGKGPEFIVTLAGYPDHDNAPHLLASSVSASGSDGKDLNLMFPPYAVESGKNVTLTIDVEKVAANSKSKDDPVASESIIYIDAIKVTNAPAIGAAKYLGFCANWLPNNVWGSGTPYKIEKSGYYAGSDAYLITNLEYKPAKTTVKFDLQVLNPASDATFWDAASKVLDGTVATETYLTSELAGNHYVLVFDRASTKYGTEEGANNTATRAQLIPTKFFEYSYTVKKVTLKGYTGSIENPAIIGDFTDWSSDIEGTKDSAGNWVYDVNKPVSNSGFKFRTQGAWNGDFPSNNITWPVFVGSANVTCTYNADGSVTAVAELAE